MSSLAVAVRHRVLAFEAPLRERRALRALNHAVCSHMGIHASVDKQSKYYCSVAIADAEVFDFLSYLLSPEGLATYPDETQQLMNLLSLLSTNTTVQMQETNKVGTFTHWEDAVARYAVKETDESHLHQGFVLITYRPKRMLPLYMASARRAVKFVNAVVALVTANAYISTLGGGHFLCRHLNQSTLLAKLQIGISMGLKDPILESKCRVNLMYNALQLGRFKRARRILRQEKLVAEQLESDELRKVCHAASVYLDKMDHLHKERVLFHANNGCLHDNFYRQRIVRMTK